MSASKKTFSLQRVIALLLVVYSITVWYAIEHVTRWGQLIYEWREEYFGVDSHGSGSLKMRGPEAITFSFVSFPYAILVYPAAFVATVQLIRIAQRSPSIGTRVLCGFLAALMLAILIRFFQVGVLECAITS